MELVDISAPIIPNEGLGGIELRKGIGDYPHLVNLDTWLSGEMELDMFGPFRVCYDLPRFGFQIDVDPRNALITYIKAYAGYAGTLFGQIGVGTLVSEALKLAPDLYWDEMDSILYSEIHDGVFLGIGGDAPLEKIPSLPIEAIWVYVPKPNEPKTPPKTHVRWDAEGRPYRLG